MEFLVVNRGGCTNAPPVSELMESDDVLEANRQVVATKGQCYVAVRPTEELVKYFEQVWLDSVNNGNGKIN